ncbi:hypothetical protein PoB_006840600 [Plakobranchus ocellatus]|uniref:Uncharacterized protein n=1 Tax=Plakobranchus ocellatus TaxID=259542 RepID=A0AAV4DCW1_9GAST|nr:hypothetical protein PoB_006840600 [Plakobranchus ocellatus]
MSPHLPSKRRKYTEQKPGSSSENRPRQIGKYPSDCIPVYANRSSIKGSRNDGCVFLIEHPNQEGVYNSCELHCTNYEAESLANEALLHYLHSACR